MRVYVFVFEYKINMHSASTYYVNFYSGFDSPNVLQSVQYIGFFIKFSNKPVNWFKLPTFEWFLKRGFKLFVVWNKLLARFVFECFQPRRHNRFMYGPVALTIVFISTHSNRTASLQRCTKYPLHWIAMQKRTVRCLSTKRRTVMFKCVCLRVVIWAARTSSGSRS